MTDRIRKTIKLVLDRPQVEITCAEALPRSAVFSLHAAAMMSQKLHIT